MYTLAFSRVVSGGDCHCRRALQVSSCSLAAVSKVWSTMHHFFSFNIVNGNIRLYNGHNAEPANQKLPASLSAHSSHKLYPRYRRCLSSHHNFTSSLRRFPTSPCLTAKKEMHSFSSKSFWLLFGSSSEKRHLLRLGLHINSFHFLLCIHWRKLKRIGCTFFVGNVRVPHLLDDCTN